MAAYRTTRKVLFQHCDSTGFVFYPRYLEMINAVVEEWFEVALGLPFAEMHMQRQASVPAVHLEIDFRAPSRIGERIEFQLGVERCGRSSVTCGLRVLCGEEARLEGHLVLVYYDKRSGRAQSYPDDVMSKMRTFLVGA